MLFETQRCSVPSHFTEKLCLKSPKSFLDRVSTGSGSDLVSDKDANFTNDFFSYMV